MTVEAITTLTLLDEAALEQTLGSVDLVCVTDWDRDSLVSPSLRTLTFYSESPLQDPRKRCLSAAPHPFLLRWYLWCCGLHILRPTQSRVHCSVSPVSFSSISLPASLPLSPAHLQRPYCSQHCPEEYQGHSRVFSSSRCSTSQVVRVDKKAN